MKILGILVDLTILKKKFLVPTTYVSSRIKIRLVSNADEQICPIQPKIVCNLTSDIYAFRNHGRRENLMRSPNADCQNVRKWGSIVSVVKDIIDRNLFVIFAKKN